LGQENSMPRVNLVINLQEAKPPNTKLGVLTKLLGTKLSILNVGHQNDI
jgi:hypothetical protein